MTLSYSIRLHVHNLNNRCYKKYEKLNSKYWVDKISWNLERLISIFHLADV